MKLSKNVTSGCDEEQTRGMGSVTSFLNEGIGATGCIIETDSMKLSEKDSSGCDKEQKKGCSWCNVFSEQKNLSNWLQN